MTQKEKNKKTDSIPTISPNTHIIFTIKGFIGTILSILVMFIGFYKLVIQPTIINSITHQKELYTEQRKYMDKEFDEIKNAIKINTSAINANNERFRDLNQSFEDISDSGGSLGSGINANNSSPNSNVSSD